MTTAAATLGAAEAPVLRVAAAWGTTIVGVRMLERGRSCVLGTGPDALAVMPDELSAPEVPLRATGGGWELDARGAIAGVLMLRGREENLLQIARTGAPVPVLPGDYGLVQYGLFSIFFQYTTAAHAMKNAHRPASRWSGCRSSPASCSTSASSGFSSSTGPRPSISSRRSS